MHDSEWSFCAGRVVQERRLSVSSQGTRTEAAATEREGTSWCFKGLCQLVRASHTAAASEENRSSEDDNRQQATEESGTRVALSWVRQCAAITRHAV